MGRVGERFGRWDERTARDDEGVGWWLAMYVVVGAVVAVLIAVGRRAFGDADYAVVGVAAIAIVALYVLWRRRRNRRLTGSSTTWPT